MAYCITGNWCERKHLQIHVMAAIRELFKPGRHRPAYGPHTIVKQVL